MPNRAKTKSKTRKTTPTHNDAAYGDPKFPYCTTPSSLRRFLKEVPDKPKPPKIDNKTLKTWGFKSSNDSSIPRVLKSLGLLAVNGDTTDQYAEFMKKEGGAAALGQRIKVVYGTLFQNIKNPAKATNEELKNVFNVYSGGKERTIQLQIETFKALADNAAFDGTSLPPQPSGVNPIGSDSANNNGFELAIRIDLHIHLPENKSKADYDAILESIATHLYKRGV